MIINTLSKIALVAAIPLSFTQANAQAAAARAARQALPGVAQPKPGTAVKPNGLQVVNPNVMDGALKGPMSVSVAESILGQDKTGQKIVSYLNSDQAKSAFSANEISIITEAAARGLLNNKATVECISGLESEVSRERYAAVVNSALEILQQKGLSFNTAIRTNATLVEMSAALTDKLAELQGVNEATVAIDRAGAVVGECAIRGELNPVPMATAVKAKLTRVK
jgi:hypothetical protein